ncbi:nuclear transport factor 2 family protein [Acaryochloris sp. 'Moss Beach']|uniref:nuclear transport factor 2 family protein n=1 Tax=Acaryochloris sp. 'Moss Beach' TaxID=2740837 RepID=UPI0037C046DA|nr:nuclear transport factor 2 family protein [Acaryochloris sp. 'Moss Beach']
MINFEISGPAAVAKVEFINWSGFRFTDFSVLYKHNGEWKISGQVFDAHTQN